MRRRIPPLTDTTPELIDLVETGLRNLQTELDIDAPRIIDYDAIEIQCLLREASDYTAVPAVQANTFSVYWHLVTGGVDCIGDAASYSDAVAFARALHDATGYPINDMTP